MSSTNPDPPAGPGTKTRSLGTLLLAAALTCHSFASADTGPPLQHVRFVECDRRHADRSYTGWAQLAVMDERRGFRLVETAAEREAADAARPAIDWWFVPSTRKVFPDSRSTGVNRGQLSAARNEYESVQLVLRSDGDLAGVRVELESGSRAARLPVEWVELFEVAYVRTPGIARWGFPPKYPESRRAVYPDPLIPLTGGSRDGTISLPAGETRSVWIRVFVPSEARPGRYDARIVITVEQMDPIQAPVSLDVQPFGLPRATSVRTAVGITHRDIAKFHHVRQNSPECQDLYQRYYDELLRYRICAYELPFRVDDPAARPYLLDERVNSFHAPYGKTTWKYLQDLGVGHKAWLYLVDEPEKQDQYETLKNHGRYIRREMPGLRHGVPFFVGPEWDKSLTPFDVLTGYVDLWVCQTDYYHHGHGQGDKVRIQMRERFDAGDETWWYVAAGPREPFCNLFINLSALQHRVLFWQIYADPIITGLMYWRATHWWEVEDPFTDVATVKGIDPHLYGDGMLFYPGHRFGINGPLGSIRLESMRDGLEDHEYLVLAEELLGREAVMQLAGEVTRSLTDYTRDPAEFHQVRLRLTGMLTRLETPAAND